MDRQKITKDTLERVLSLYVGQSVSGYTVSGDKPVAVVTTVSYDKITALAERILSGSGHLILRDVRSFQYSEADQSAVYRILCRFGEQRRVNTVSVVESIFNTVGSSNSMASVTIVDYLRSEGYLVPYAGIDLSRYEGILTYQAFDDYISTRNIEVLTKDWDKTNLATGIPAIDDKGNMPSVSIPEPEKPKELDVRASIFVDSSDQATRMEFMDRLAGTTFLSIEMTGLNFLAMLRGKGYTECKGFLRGLDKVGKKLEINSFVIEADGFRPTDRYNAEKVEAFNRRVLQEVPEGWTPDFSLNHQNTFFQDGGKDFIRISTRRWV